MATISPAGNVETIACAACDALIRESPCPKCGSTEVYATWAWEQEGRLYQDRPAVGGAVAAEMAEWAVYAETSRLERLSRGEPLLPHLQQLRSDLDPSTTPKICKWLDDAARSLRDPGANDAALITFAELALLAVPDGAEEVDQLNPNDWAYARAFPTESLLMSWIAARVRYRRPLAPERFRALTTPTFA